MKNTFKPILFSTPMVQAIQNGTKTQTRRTKGLESVNENPDNYRYGIVDDEKDSCYGLRFFENLDKQVHPKEKYTFEEGPYTIGDILWVRESFYTAENFGHFKPRDLPFYGIKVYYLADDDNDYIPKPLYRSKIKPSIFLPKEYARIFLKITNIRAERLTDISEEDAVCEGVEQQFSNLFNENRYKDYANVKSDWRSSISSFQSLWASINGFDSWDKNPWVWVIEFEKVERPNDFIV